MAVKANIANTSAWDDLRKRVKDIGTRTVAVGVFGDEELAIVAASHEYGTERVPERSYLRSTLYDKPVAMNRFMKRLGAAYLKGTLTDALHILDLLGIFAVNQVKAKIRSNIPPALALETVKRKGSTIALIDTGRLLASIDHQVNP